MHYFAQFWEKDAVSRLFRISQNTLMFRHKIRNPREGATELYIFSRTQGEQTAVQYISYKTNFLLHFKYHCLMVHKLYMTYIKNIF